MESAWASAQGQASTEDLAAFADLEKSSWSVVEETIDPRVTVLRGARHVGMNHRKSGTLSQGTRVSAEDGGL